MEITLRNMSVFASAVKDVKHAAMVPEVQHALLAWIKSKIGAVAPGVLIGGLAMSFYSRPRETTDVDLLFLSDEQIPKTVSGFKRHRNGAFEEFHTQVEIELTTPSSVNLPQSLVKHVFETAVDHEGLLVASKEAMVALKLFGADTPRREFKDLNDIVSILGNYPDLDLAAWRHFLTQAHIAKFEDCLRRAGN